MVPMSAFLPLCKKGLNEPIYFFRFPSSERYFTQKQLLVGYILSDTLTLLLHDDIVYRIAKCKVRVKKFNICIALYHFNIIYLLFQSQVNVMKLPMASKCIEVSEGYLGPYQASMMEFFLLKTINCFLQNSHHKSSTYA